MRTIAATFWIAAFLTATVAVASGLMWALYDPGMPHLIGQQAVAPGAGSADRPTEAGAACHPTVTPDGMLCLDVCIDGSSDALVAMASGVWSAAVDTVRFSPAGPEVERLASSEVVPGANTRISVATDGWWPLPTNTPHRLQVALTSPAGEATVVPVSPQAIRAAIASRQALQVRTPGNALLATGRAGVQN